MNETPRTSRAQPTKRPVAFDDVILVGKFTNPTKYYVVAFVLPLLLVASTHVVFYCYKDGWLLHLNAALSNLKHDPSFVTGMSYLMAVLSRLSHTLNSIPDICFQIFYAAVLGVAVTVYGCIMVYLNSADPGIDPPSPIRSKEDRAATGSRMGFSYIMAIGIGVLTFFSALFPGVFIGSY